MWHKIRGFIWNQYQDHTTDMHVSMFNDLVKDIVSRASMCMSRLSYNKYISPLLTVRRPFAIRQHFLTIN